MMRKVALLVAVGFFLACLAGPVKASNTATGIPPAESLRLLKEGNARYLKGKPRHPHQDRVRRAMTTGQGQHPLAAVLTCSDSRVPPEIIFDQGIGDIFVVRVAGNVAATDEIGSLEYAVDHLNTPVVIVMGHTQCDAITAVLDDAKLPPNMDTLVEPIRSAVAKVRKDNPKADREVLLQAATRENVWQSIADMLEQSPIIRERVKEGRVTVVGALYEIDSGQIQWLGPHPEQDDLVRAKKGRGKSGKRRR